ncbi:phosphatase PAP2 family protein [Streptomyces purpureus]|uniref:Phosphatase PAP2 family protein n=1 Tax=Streptomyces purpureus TaxID=1951 RepID=A0A918LQZ3_9ACTN|nr:phosphatase PAP2 family protein [Streptomyces purpureus]GGT37665.1 phosphatase PAP2 family protein [Streptomyces purpureus]
MSQDLYLTITDFARSTPSWFQFLAELWTEAGLLLFGVLFVVGWFRSRSLDSRAMALALLAPLATAFGYVVSEAFKSLVDEERPCRAVVGAGPSLVECPPYGDWSFPSNHSAIAGAAAMAVTLALVASWRWIAWPAAVMAVLMAFSRVFVGVHYPHDVTVGLVLGALIAFLFMRLLTKPAVGLVEACRSSRNGAVVWCVGRGARAHAATVRREQVHHHSS